MFSRLVTHDENNQDKNTLVDLADNSPSLFVMGTGVREEHCERIKEDPPGRFEIEAVLREIEAVFRLVPFEGRV